MPRRSFGYGQSRVASCPTSKSSRHWRMAGLGSASHVGRLRVVRSPPSILIPGSKSSTGRAPRRRESPEVRAGRLLRSLLNPEQHSDWMTRRRFLVKTQFGRVELGQLFNIGFWPRTGESIDSVCSPQGPSCRKRMSGRICSLYCKRIRRSSSGLPTGVNRPTRNGPSGRSRDSAGCSRRLISDREMPSG